MRTLTKRFFVLSALLACQLSAHALYTYSSFAPGDAYNAGSGWLVNGSQNPPQPYVGEAFAFTAGSSGFLSQVNLAISSGSGDLEKDRANIFITSNSSANLPGTPLESFLNVSSSGWFGAANPIASLPSTLNPFLQSGVTYWLCVRPASTTAAITVNQNSLGLLAPQAQEFSPSSWIARGSKTTFAFSVEVLPVPEPSTAALSVLGICLLPFLRVMRK